MKKLCDNDEGVLHRSEDLKIKMYSSPISSQCKVELLPLAISLNGGLGLCSETFFKNFNQFTTSSSYLIALRREVTNLPLSIWSECFPSDTEEIPIRELLSLNLAFKKLQQKLVKVFEQQDFNVRLSLAKNNNPAFANFLLDL
ncbi:hypothetical protein RCL1_008231 [Eukaryota sp. TZLM3-RCL]